VESLIAKNRVNKELGSIVTSKENAQIWRILQKFALLPIIFSFPFFLCWLSKLFCKSYNYLKCFARAENWCCLIDYLLKIKRKGNLFITFSN
jgi:tRNA nucleotidyltransferase/poly(A) polymerase